MSGIELIVMAAGTAMSAAGAYSAGQTQKAMGEAEAASLRQRADWEQAVGQRNAEIEKKKADAVASEQLARFAASGGGTGGSAAGVMAQTKARGEFNALMVQAQSTEQAAGLRDNANIKKYAGDRAATGGMIGAGGTILTGMSAFGRAGGFNSASYRAG
jgi:hypothetical protein